MKNSTRDQVESKVQEKTGQIKKVFGKYNGVLFNGTSLRTCASNFYFVFFSLSYDFYPNRYLDININGQIYP